MIFARLMAQLVIIKLEHLTYFELRYDEVRDLLRHLQGFYLVIQNSVKGEYYQYNLFTRPHLQQVKSCMPLTAYNKSTFRRKAR